MAQYGKSEYWEERYTRDAEPFDWYQRWAGVRDVITQHITPSHQILNIGAGNSRMSEEMFDEGFTNITNIDISQVVIKAMQEKYRDKQPSMKYQQMDVRSLEFSDGSFDSVVDKGTLDSVLCGDGSTANTMKMLSEIYRVLGPNGVYIAISYGAPAQRLRYLEKPEFAWNVTEHQVAKPTISATLMLATDDRDQPNVHYIYVCKKGGRTAA